MATYSGHGTTKTMVLGRGSCQRPLVTNSEGSAPWPVRQVLQSFPPAAFFSKIVPDVKKGKPFRSQDGHQAIGLSCQNSDRFVENCGNGVQVFRQYRYSNILGEMKPLVSKRAQIKHRHYNLGAL